MQSNDMVPRPRNGLSLCAGGGGLDMGLMLAEPGYETRCHVEWEPYPRETLIGAMRAGYFAQAPIWDNVKTFDARPLAGAIDTVLAGYPCQPFSAAGKRQGEDDERHLWPDVERIIGELGPAVRWVFLENVDGHISLGGETVLRALRNMGFTPAMGIFSAAEVGANHGRKRLFIVAHRAGDNGHRRGQGQPAGKRDDPDRRAELANHDSKRAEYERDCNGRGNEAPNASTVSGGNHELADTRESGLQGRERSGPSEERNRPVASGPVAEFRFPFLFPPGPSDHDAWSIVMAAAPSGVPAYSRRDLVSAAIRSAALVPPDAAHALERRAGEMDTSAILDAMEAETRQVLDNPAFVSDFRHMADGLALRPRALRLLGNGVCPLAAGYAWRTLSPAHGLRPVDLGTAETPAARDTA